MALTKTEMKEACFRVGDKDIKIPVLFQRYATEGTNVIQVAIDFNRLAPPPPDGNVRSSRNTRWASALILLQYFRAIIIAAKQLKAAPATEDERRQNKLLGRICFLVEIGAAYRPRGGAILQRTVSRNISEQYFDPVTSDFFPVNLKKESDLTEKDHGVLAEHAAQTKPDIQTPKQMSEFTSALLLGEYAKPDGAWVNLWTEPRFQKFAEQYKAAAITSPDDWPGRKMIIFTFCETLRKKASQNPQNKKLLAIIQFLTELAFNSIYETLIPHVLFCKNVKSQLDAISRKFNRRFHAMQDIALAGMVPVLHPLWSLCMKSSLFLDMALKSLGSDKKAKARFNGAWSIMTIMYQGLTTQEEERQEARSKSCNKSRQLAVGPIKGGEIESNPEDMRCILMELMKGTLTDSDIALFTTYHCQKMTMEQLAQTEGCSITTISRRLKAIQRKIASCRHSSNPLPNDGQPVPHEREIGIPKRTTETEQTPTDESTESFDKDADTSEENHP